jgi:Polyketide cyclase / dehydrase and lipid transport
MASIIRDTVVDVDGATAWDALRDFGAVHERLAPGFLVACETDGPDVRVVTFADGAVVREVLVGADDAARRLAYTVVEAPLVATHHNASAQVFDDGEGRCRFVWITDVLPDDVAPRIAQLMDSGIGVIKETLEEGTTAGAGGGRGAR